MIKSQNCHAARAVSQINRRVEVESHSMNFVSAQLEVRLSSTWPMSSLRGSNSSTRDVSIKITSVLEHSDTHTSLWTKGGFAAFPLTLLQLLAVHPWAPMPALCVWLKRAHCECSCVAF
jgi:hypothetical protein